LKKRAEAKSSDARKTRSGLPRGRKRSVQLENNGQGNLLVSEAAVRLLLWGIEHEKHTLIVGPRGCGKTTFARWAGERLGRRVEVFHFGGVFDAEATVTGFMALRNGETTFLRSRFIEAVRIPDSVLILDELNRAPANVHNALLSLMDFQSRIVLDLESSEERVVTRAPGVVFVSTANQGSDYVGTEPLDAALLDRMQFIYLDYPSQEEELVARCGLPTEQAKRLVAIARSLRRLHASGRVPATISTRGVIEMAERVAAGFGVEDAFEAVVPVFDEAGRAALRTTIRGSL
jgi:nitric oxide reductase NorQ protein